MSGGRDPDPSHSATAISWGACQVLSVRSLEHYTLGSLEALEFPTVEQALELPAVCCISFHQVHDTSMHGLAGGVGVEAVESKVQNSSSSRPPTPTEFLSEKSWTPVRCGILENFLK